MTKQLNKINQIIIRLKWKKYFKEKFKLVKKFILLNGKIQKDKPGNL